MNDFSHLGKVVGGRLLQAILTALAASVIIFALLPLAAGDPALRVLTASGVLEPSREQIQAMRDRMGLDRPLVEQYATWLGRVVRGDLSTSYTNNRPVTGELAKRLPATLLLTGTALLLATALAICGALMSAIFQNKWPDQVIRTLTQIGACTPTFLLGLLILQYAVIGLKFGRVLSDADPKLVLLPALCLCIGPASSWTQLLRASLLEALGSNYALVARARGATRLRVLLRYALPNASPPFLTAIGVGIGAMIGGAPIIEGIFTWPGIGSYVLEAISARDYPVIQGFVLISSLAYVGASLFIDLANTLLDPRLREAGAA